jgi:hypothetical protein
MLRYNTPTAPRVEPARTGGYGVTRPDGIPQSRQASGSGTAPGPFLMRHGEIVTTPRSAARPSAMARAASPFLWYVDTILGTLRAAGFSVDEAAHAFWLLDSYV